MLLDIVPEELQEAYGPKEKAKIGFVYMEIQKVMYGLPQSVILANKLFNKRLTELGYFEMLHTLGLWKHVSRPISFTLVVNDFGIKYVGQDHAEHLINTIKNYYNVKMGWTGGLYCGIKLECNYDKMYLDI